jgi:hypothetical protein
MSPVDVLVIVLRLAQRRDLGRRLRAWPGTTRSSLVEVRKKGAG